MTSEYSTKKALRSLPARHSIIFAALLALNSLTHGTSETALTYNFTGSTILDHFHDKTITSLLEDSSGILWIGTQSGLYIFAGGIPKNISDYDSRVEVFGRTSIAKIAEDHDGYIWALSTSGILARFSFQNYALTAELVPLSTRSGDRFIGLLHTANGITWAWNDRDIRSLDRRLVSEAANRGSISRLSFEGPIVDVDNDPSNRFLVVLTEGRIYEVAYSGKILRESASIRETISEGDRYTDLLIAEDHTLLLSANGLILSYSDSTVTVAMTPAPNNGVSYTANSILLQDQWLVVGTDQGLLFSDRNKGDGTFWLKAGNSQMSNDHVTALGAGTSRIWVGTFNGLNLLSPKYFEHFFDRNSGISNEVLSFTEDPQGRLWIGTYSGVYYRTEVDSVYKHASPRVSLPDSRVMTIQAVDDEIWLGLREGGVASIINDSSGSFSRLPTIEQLESKSVTAIKPALRNTAVLIATISDGIYIYRRNERSLRKLLEDVDRVTYVVSASQNIACFGNENRLFCSTSELKEIYEVELAFPSQSDNEIISIAIADNGTIFLGTLNDGIYTGKTPTPESRILNLHALDIWKNGYKAVHTITLAGEAVWLTSSDGVISLDSNLNVLARFTESEGVQGREFNTGASLLGTDGRLYFGGSNGYHSVDSKLKAVRRPIPKMGFFQSTEVDSGTALRSKSLNVLGPSQKVLRFNYNIIDYYQPQASNYRHKLEGFDNDWVDTGTLKTTTYTNLDPGRYTFRVQGADSTGTWNRAGLTMDILVLPPWWATWWAYALYTIIAWLVLLTLKRWYDTTVIKDQAVARAREMTAAADDAVDELQDELELQDQIFARLNARNIDLISLTELHRASSGDVTQSTIQLVSLAASLQALENSLTAFEDDLQFNLGKYFNDMLNLYLSKSGDKTSSIITIVDVTELPVASFAALRLSLIGYEFLEEFFGQIIVCDASAPIVTVRLSSPYYSAEKSRGWLLTLAVEQLENAAANGQRQDLANRIKQLCDDLESEPLIEGNNSSVQVIVEIEPSIVSKPS